MSKHDWAWLGEIKDENFAVPIYLSTIVSTKAPKLTLGSHCCQPKSVNSLILPTGKVFLKGF